jgi:hypothetical protein
MNCLWTDKKNRFKIETVNAIVSVKENAEFKCSEAFELFMLNSGLLKPKLMRNMYNDLLC